MALQRVKLIVLNVICSKIAKMPDLPTPPSVKIPKLAITIHARQPCHEAFGMNQENRVGEFQHFALSRLCIV